METQRNSKIIVFILIIALVFSAITPLVGTPVYAAGEGGGTGIGNTEVTNYVAPDAATITYPALLNKSSLGGSTTVSNGSINGHWEWEDPEIKPTASAIAGGKDEDGNYISENLKYKVHFVFEKEEDRRLYKDLTTEVAIVVNKGNIKKHYYGETTTINYGERLFDSKFDKHDAKTVMKDDSATIVPGDWSWDGNSEEIYPTAYAIGTTSRSSLGSWKEFPATFKPENDNYNIFHEAKYRVYVHKVKPIVGTPPTASDINYGQSLDKSILTSPDAVGVTKGSLQNESVAGTWHWLSGGTLNANVPNGEKLSAYFVPKDNMNYFSDVNYALRTLVNVKVKQSILRVDTGIYKPKATSIIYGQKLSDSVISSGIVYNTNSGIRVYGDWDWKDTVKNSTPDASTSPQAAVFEPGDKANNPYLDYGIDVQVSKFTPTVKDADKTESISITYGALLKDKNISDTVRGYDGERTVNGEWVWTNENTELQVGVTNQRITFVPKDRENGGARDGNNYNEITRTIQVTVEPADLVIDTEPTASSIIYLNNASSSKISSGVVTFAGVQVGGYWKWSDQNFVPTKDSVSQEAIFVITQPGVSTKNFNELKTSLKIPVTPAKVHVSEGEAPVISGITYGQLVSEAGIGNRFTVLNDNDLRVGGIWEWLTPSALLPAGTISHTAIFTPLDANLNVNENYAPLLYEFSVEVAKADPKIIQAPNKVQVDVGTYTSEVAINEDGTAVVHGVTDSSINGTWKFDYSNDNKPLEIGTYTKSAVFTADGGNYNSKTTDVALEVVAKSIEKDQLTFGDGESNVSPASVVTVSALITAGEPLTKYAITGPSILDYKIGTEDYTTIKGIWDWGENENTFHAGDQPVEIVFYPEGNEYGPVRYVIVIVVKKIIIDPDSVKDSSGAAIENIVKPDTPFGIGEIIGGNNIDNITGPSVVYIGTPPDQITLSGIWSWEDSDEPIKSGTNTAIAVFKPDSIQDGDDEYNDYYDIKFEIEFYVDKINLDPDNISDESGTPLNEAVSPGKAQVIAKDKLTDAGISGPEIIKISDGEDPPNYTTISGIWSWKKPNDKAKYGTNTATAIFTPCEQYSMYKTFEIDVTFDAIKIDLDNAYVTGPNNATLSSIVAPDGEIIPKTKLTDSGITGPSVIYLHNGDESIEITGNWSWENSDQIIKGNNNTAAAIFTPSDEDYDTIKIEVSFDATQLELDADSLTAEDSSTSASALVTPNGIFIPGDTLSKSSISGPAVLKDAAGVTYGGIWSWKDDYELVVSNNAIVAVFTPTDEDYGPIEYNINYFIPQIHMDPDKLTITADSSSSKVAVCLAPDIELGAGSKLNDSKPTVPGVFYNGEPMPGEWRWADEDIDYIVGNGTNTVSAIFTPDNGDYAEIEIEFIFQVTKTAYNADDLKGEDGASISSILSRDLDIKPRKELNDQKEDQSWPENISAGGATLTGEWSFEDGDTVLTAGAMKRIKIKFQPSPSAIYVPVYITVYVTVDAIDLGSVKPDADNINSKDLIFHGDTLGDHEIVAPDIEYEGDTIDGEWKWKYPDATVTDDQTTATAIFVPTDSDFADIEIEVAIKVLPSEDTITESALKTEDGRNIKEDIKFDQKGFSAGDTLERIYIQGPTVYINGQEIKGEWNWRSKGDKPQIGKSKHDLVFTPENDRIDPITMEVEINVDPVKAAGLTLNYTSKNINKGNTLQLRASIKPDNTSYKDVTWTSSNPKIASVNVKTGLVKANNTEGQVTITAKIKDGKTAKCTIKVVTPVTKIRTSLSTLTLKKKTKYRVYPVADNGSKKISTKITYKSSNKKVATVSSKGVIKAKKKGTAKITITAYNGKTKVIKIKVVTKKKALTKAKLKFGKKIRKGKTKQIKIYLSPKRATNVKVTYKSSNKRIATVDKAGRITAKKKGKVKITIKVGGKTYKKTIRVVK